MGLLYVGEVEVGEALPLRVDTDFDLTGATVAARISINGAAATDHTGTLGAAVGGVIKTAYVSIPGATMSAAGTFEGVVVLTLGGATWSPSKERFSGLLKAVV